MLRALNLIFFFFFFFEAFLRKLLQFLFKQSSAFHFFFLDFSNVCESVLTSSCMCSFVGENLRAIHSSELGYIF